MPIGRELVFGWWRCATLYLHHRTYEYLDFFDCGITMKRMSPPTVCQVAIPLL
jgi:hypothetical protein